MTHSTNGNVGLPDFTGKVLSVCMIDSECHHDLISPVFSVQGGRLFLVGIVPKGASTTDWSAGLQCALAWERVTEYTVHDSYEKYVAATQTNRDFRSRGELDSI